MKEKIKPIRDNVEGQLVIKGLPTKHDAGKCQLNWDWMVIIVSKSMG